MLDFYSALLGWEVTYSDENAGMISSGVGPALGFGAISDYQPPSWPDDGHKQFHLDLDVDDIDAAVARAVELGGTLPDDQPGERWKVVLDPAGHPFCFAHWNS